MSNTDGEDTKRKTVEEILQGCLQGLSVRIPHLLIRYVHIAMQTYADQELASLREQLAQCEKVKEEKHKRYDELFASLSTRNDELNTTRKQLQQKEDENRELLTVLKSIESKYTPFNKRVHDDDIYAITEVLRKNLSA